MKGLNWTGQQPKTHRIHGAGIYANIGGILMGSMLPYTAYMDPMGNEVRFFEGNSSLVRRYRKIPSGYD